MDMGCGLFVFCWMLGEMNCDVGLRLVGKIGWKIFLIRISVLCVFVCVVFCNRCYWMFFCVLLVWC